MCSSHYQGDDRMSPRCHIATRKGLFTLEHRAGGWAIVATSFLGDPCTAVMQDRRSDVLLAALNHGHFGVKMHRSRDGGASWEEVGTPVYPPQPEGYTPRVPTEGVPAEWSLKQVWALASGGADESGVIWCGTLPGGLFRSDDDGDTWALNRALWDDPLREEWFGGGADYPGIHSICVDPRDPHHVLVAVSCGGVWRSRDGGASWALGGTGMRADFMPPERQYEPNIQDPHLMVQSHRDPDVLWVQHHNGIFRSTDGAATWTELQDVTPSSFGFPVAVHPHDPDTAWFVPATKDEKRYAVGGRVVVNRTRDGGRSFESLGRGLPQEHAYDLVYRHALAVDDSGEHLLFGSTTGSVWASDDGGDSWQTVSSNLPPVYAVHFGATT
jgi:hypothetical protein